MRLLAFFLLLAVVVACSSYGSAGANRTDERPDIGRSGTEFMEVCSSIDAEWNQNPDRIRNDASCLGWVEGFADGFTVHDELLGVPRTDRIACIPHKVTTIQTVRAMKKYISDHPEKAHRPTRYVVSLALAQAFPCKAGK